MNNVLLLFSGGLDSTTLLYFLFKKNVKPILLFIDYGQRHKKEFKSALKIAKKLKLSIKKIKLNLSFIKSSLINKKSKIKFKNTYIPARNIIFLSIAVSFAESNNLNKIYIGVNKNDNFNFPDTKYIFIKQFNKLVSYGIKKKIKVIAPFSKKSKEEIIKLGKKLNVPFNLTWSCYEGGKNPCGKCEPCLLRKKYLQ